MKKQRNKRGKLTRKEFTQIIVESPLKKDGTKNHRFPGTKTIFHTATIK
jgi:uncharacterized protein YwbE